MTKDPSASDAADPRGVETGRSCATRPRSGVDLKLSRYAVIEGIAPFEERLLPKGHHKQVWGKKARCGVGWIGDDTVRWFLGGRGVALVDDPGLSKEQLIERVAGMPEVVTAMLEATEEDQIVRTEVRHGYPPERWHSHRTLLLGDAAHTLSPFAGMGAARQSRTSGTWFACSTSHPTCLRHWSSSSESASAT